MSRVFRGCSTHEHNEIENLSRVFIIESTDDDDEEHDRKEGKALTAILQLANRPVLYRYIRTKKELEKMLQQFHAATYRYLHLACHGNQNEIGLNCDDLSLAQMADRLAPRQFDQRLARCRDL